MRQHFFNSSFILFCFLITISAAANSQSAQAPVNPDLVYFSKGDTPDKWQWVLSDPGNYWIPLEGNIGVTERGVLEIGPALSPQFPGAVKLQWKKTQKGGDGTAKITGRTVDLSAYEKKAKLMLALKLEKRDRKPVSVYMTCGDNCKGSVPIQHHLKAAKMNQWFALPIPLDCFVAQGADLKKISTPFAIKHSGKMVLDIAEVSIRPLDPGEVGCSSGTDDSKPKSEEKPAEDKK